MTFTDLVARLEPAQQHVVSLVYGEGLTGRETARVLAVEHAAVGAALAVAYRVIATVLVEQDDGQEASTAVTTRLSS